MHLKQLKQLAMLLLITSGLCGYHTTHTLDDQKKPQRSQTRVEQLLQKHPWLKYTPLALVPPAALYCMKKSKKNGGQGKPSASPHESRSSSAESLASALEKSTKAIIAALSLKNDQIARERATWHTSQPGSPLPGRSPKQGSYNSQIAYDVPQMGLEETTLLPRRDGLHQDSLGNSSTYSALSFSSSSSSSSSVSSSSSQLTQQEAIKADDNQAILEESDEEEATVIKKEVEKHLISPLANIVSSYYEEELQLESDSSLSSSALPPSPAIPGTISIKGKIGKADGKAMLAIQAKDGRKYILYAINDTREGVWRKINFNGPNFHFKSNIIPIESSSTKDYAVTLYAITKDEYEKLKKEYASSSKHLSF